MEMAARITLNSTANLICETQENYIGIRMRADNHVVRASCTIQSFRRPLLAILVYICIITCQSPKENGALAFPTRNAINPCSLDTSPASKTKLSNFCSLASTAGGEGPREMLYMRFGETGCTVTLKNCIPKGCYFVLEDAAPNVEHNVVQSKDRTSFLVNVTADPNTATLIQTSSGFAFKPISKTVRLHYSTATCGDYYMSRERAEKQICGATAIEAITNVLPAGLPFDTMCSFL